MIPRWCWTEWALWALQRRHAVAAMIVELADEDRTKMLLTKRPVAFSENSWARLTDSGRA